MTTIKLRRDTAAAWTTANPTLAAGELGLETDTGKLKAGTGAAVWTALAYLVTGGAAGTSALTPTAIKTTAYTAAVGQLALMNVAGGATTLTLPTAPADKAQVGVRAIGATTAVPLTIARGGSDTIGLSSATTGSITLDGKTDVLQYDAANTRWLLVSGIPDATLTARFAPTSGLLSARPTATGSRALYTATDVGGGTTYLDTAAGVWTQTAGPVSPALFGPITNATPQNLVKTRRMFARVRAGVGPGTLFCVGDSTTRGEGAGTVGAYPTHLARQLSSSVVPAAQTWLTATAFYVDVPDPRIVTKNNWNLAGIQYFFGNTALTINPCAASVAGPPVIDTIDIWLNTATGTAFDVSIDGGASVLNVPVQGGSIRVVKKTVTVPRGAHTVTITPTSGNVFIQAINCYDSTTPVVQVCNFAQSGLQSDAWATNGSGSAADPSFVASIYSPDLIVYDIGLNDGGNNVPIATYQANVQTFVTAGKNAGCDMVLKSFTPPQSAGANAIYGTYVDQALPALSAANNLPLVDGFRRFVSWAFSNPLGYYFDSVHPSSTGYADVAASLVALFRAI